MMMTMMKWLLPRSQMMMTRSLIGGSNKKTPLGVFLFHLFEGDSEKALLSDAEGHRAL